MTVRTITDPAEFEALGPEWDALVRAMPRPSPFLLHAWLVTWWRHYGDRDGMRVHVVRSGGRLEAALPLHVTRRAGLRVVRFLGDEAAALADLMLAPGAAPGTARALVAHAAADGGDFADLFGLPAASRLAAAADGDLALVPRVEAPVLDLVPDWAEVYRSRTSSKRRSLHRRRRRQLAGLGDLGIEVATTLDALEPALEAAFALHDARWRDRPEASGFATAAGRRFHRDALRAIAPLGVPRILLLTVGGRPVACNYFLLLGDRMYFHELAFDPEFARFSPGQVATLDAIEAGAAAGARRVEFLGGAERYKLELADRFEPLYQGLGLAGTRRGRAGIAARTAAVALRRRLKQTPARRIYYDHLAPARRAIRRLRS
jgi:CelD/BcsL family acetyltransferase involved in cellulose biosynthesis